MATTAQKEKAAAAARIRNASRDAIVMFIAAIAAIIGDSHWFTVRGDCEWGLCLQTQLTVDEYAAFLIAAQLVTVKKNSSSGGYTVGSGKSVWQGLFEDYNHLYEVADHTHTQVHATLFKRSKGKEVTKINIDKKCDLELICIGKGKVEGETTKGSLQLADRIEPPPMNRKLRTLQRRLLRKLNPIIDPILESDDKEVCDKLDAVIAWIKMPELEEEDEAYVTTTKYKKQVPMVPHSNSGVDGDDLDKIDVEVEVSVNDEHTKHTKAITEQPPVIHHPSKKTAAVESTQLKVASSNEHTTATLSTASSTSPAQPIITPARPITLSDIVSRATPKLTGTHRDYYVNVPTPKAAASTYNKLYPPEHANAKYRTLNSLPIDVMDRTSAASRQNFEGLVRDIMQFADDNDEPLTFESWTGRTKYKVVAIPQANDEEDFHDKAKSRKWIEETLDWSLRDGDATDVIVCMMRYFKWILPTKFKEVMVAAGVSPRQMNEYEMAATMKKAKIGIASWRMLVSCFSEFTGLDREEFTLSEAAWRKLGEGHGEIDAGKYKYYKDDDESKRPEIVQWWTMEPAAELELKLTDFANRQSNFHPDQIDYVHSIYSGDHGKGKLRFCSKLVVRLKDTSKELISVVYPIADVKCKKDNGKLFKATIKDNLAAGINRVEHGKIEFAKDNKTGDWKCSIIDPNHDNYNSESNYVQDVTAFMVGDLKFLSMMLGKENFEGNWCHLCKLQSKSWQEEGYNVDVAWDLVKLKEQAAISRTKDGVERMGVREEPYFDIAVERYIWPILHTVMGVGNAILDYIVDFVETDIQVLPPKELRMKRELHDLELDLEIQQEVRDHFDSTDLGSGYELLKQLRKDRNKARRKMEQMEDDDVHTDADRVVEYQTWREQVEECEPKIKELEKERTDMSAVVKSLNNKITKKSEQLSAFRVARKTEDDSLYTAIDTILATYDIKRAAYHGGQLTGVCVKKLMTHSEDIMKEIATVLIENKSDACKISNDEINKLCTDMATLLTRWDGAMSEIHKKNPGEEDCNRAQLFIDKAMELTRELGLSVIPKYHGAEAHIVQQMRNTKGGLHEFDESWMEQYHQTGYQFDMSLRNQPSEKKKAKVIVSNNIRVSHPSTQEAMDRHDSKRKRGRHDRTIQKEEHTKKVKEERRAKSIL